MPSGISVFPPSPRVDVTALTEHQAVNGSVNLSSLTTLMSISGKGMLEMALLVIIGTVQGTQPTTNPEIVITVDGTVVYDSGYPASTSWSASTNYYYGIAQTSNIKSNSNVITGAGAIGLGSSLEGLVTFPFSYQILASISELVALENPIYFNQSLLIQIKGATSNGTIKAMAKARY